MFRFGRLSLLIALIALAAGCSSSGGAGECAVNKDCSDGFQCRAGQCIAVAGDSGPAKKDASTSDSGVSSDTGIPDDSGVPVDSGIPDDSGVPVDSGVPDDSGVPVDSGIPDDSGVPVDSGVPADSGIPDDSGVLADTGVSDSGMGVVDSGIVDSGVGDSGNRDASNLDGAAPDGGTGACGPMTENETVATAGSNDTVATAQPLPGPGTYHGEIQVNGDTDVYALPVPVAGTLMRVTLSGASPFVPKLLAVGPGLGNFGHIARPVTVGGPASRELFFPVASTYYLVVTDRAAGTVLPGTRCYTLEIATRPAPVPTAITLPSAGAIASQSFDATSGGLVGFFKVSVPGAYLKPWVFNLVAPPTTNTSTTADVDTYLSVWDPARKLLIAASDDALGTTNSNLFAALSSSTSKDYWAVVDHYDLHDRDGNGLQANLALTVYEPRTISWTNGVPNFVDAAHSFTSTRTQEWYLATAAAGTELSIAADGIPGALPDVFTAMVDISGRLIASDPAMPAASGAITSAPTLSDRTLILIATGDGTTGGYSLSVDAPVACTPVAGATVPVAGDLAINEVLWDPAGDANGDGRINAQDDEFVELVNDTINPLDLSGVSIADGSGSINGTRHVFPCGYVLLPSRSVVVFGGGSPTGTFGGSSVFTTNVTLGCASNTAARSLCLNNAATESVVVRAAAAAGTTGAELARLNFTGLTASPNASYVRCNSATPVGPAACDSGTTMVRHNAIPTVSAAFSPGTKVDGASAFARAGEICEAPTTITTAGTLNGESTLGTGADYSPDPTPGACTGFDELGEDKVYSMVVPAGKTLSVTVTPEATYDVAVYLIEAPALNCDVVPPMCITGADLGGAGVAESTGATNTSAAPATVFIVVDSYGSGGSYSLTTALSP